MTAQSNDADRRLHPNSNPAVEPAQPLERRQAASRPTSGQSARLTRRATIRAQRQAERRAERQTSRQSRLPTAKKPGKVDQSAPSVAKLTPRTPEPTVPSAVAVHSFRPKLSLWLTALVWLQRGSGVVTLVLVTGALITYGWTVYAQERWGKLFDDLEALKKQERQLVSANEVLKNQMAEQAEKPTAGLLLPDPSNAIFLTPAPQRPPVKPRPAAPVVESDPIRPLGY